jgi:hypothetical protein
VLVNNTTTHHLDPVAPVCVKVITNAPYVGDSPPDKGSESTEEAEAAHPKRKAATKLKAKAKSKDQHIYLANTEYNDRSYPVQPKPPPYCSTRVLSTRRGRPLEACR